VRTFGAETLQELDLPRMIKIMGCDTRYEIEIADLAAGRDGVKFRGTKFAYRISHRAVHLDEQPDVSLPVNRCLTCRPGKPVRARAGERPARLAE